MSFLLDTQVFVWLLTTPDRLPPGVRARLADPHVGLVVSAASAMEVATKVRLGKFAPAEVLVASWQAQLERIRATELPITSAHAIAAGQLTWEQRDPFDRLLAAQATLENLTLVTADRELQALPGLRLLTV